MIIEITHGIQKETDYCSVYGEGDPSLLLGMTLHFLWVVGKGRDLPLANLSLSPSTPTSGVSSRMERSVMRDLLLQALPLLSTPTSGVSSRMGRSVMRDLLLHALQLPGSSQQIPRNP